MAWSAVGLSALASAAGQHVAPKPFGDNPRPVIQSWTVNQGLPQNSVLSLCRTRDGFLWVGTLGGLGQFDGWRFRVFQSTDGNTIPGDAIKFLAEDSAGTLWIGGKTITLYKAGIFEPFRLAPEFVHEGIVEMKADAHGGVWIANHRGQVLFSDGITATMVVTPAPVTGLAVNPSGGVWAASRSGLFLLRAGKVASATIAAGQSFATIVSTKTGVVVVRSGTNTSALQHGVLTRWPAFKTVWHGGMDAGDQGVWLTVDTGLALVKDGQVKQHLGLKDGLAESDVESLVDDGNGGFWAGTDSTGLQHIYAGLFNTYDQNDGLPAAPYPMVASAAGALWVGGTPDETVRSDRFLAMIKGNSIQTYGTQDGLGSGQLMGVTQQEKRGLTLAVAPSGLYRMEGSRFQQTMASPPEAYPTALLKDHLGNVWVGMHGQALHELLAAGGEKSFGEREGLLDTAIWSLAEDRAGNLWIASSKGAVVLHPGENDRVEKLAQGFIGSVYPDPDRGVWLGSFQGLRYYDGKTIRDISRKDGLPSDTVISMEKDVEGNLWAGSANGIFRLESKELEQWQQGKAVKFHVRVFGAADGLLSSQVIAVGQNTMARTPDGRLWFATTKGLSVIDPKVISREFLHAMIQEVAVDGVRQPVMPVFAVSPGRHTVKIEYTAPEMTNAKRVVFSYRLDGWDKDWVESGTSREVSYAGLPPGSYRFHVRAEYRDASGPPSLAELTLAVKPYFYQTVWFDVLILAVGGCLVWFLVVARTRASEKRLEAIYQVRLDERNRIARQLHDTLIQEVVGTALGLEVLSGRLPTDRVQDREELELAVYSLQGVIQRGRSAIVELRNQEAEVEDLPSAIEQAQRQLWAGDTPLFELHVTGVTPACLVPIYDDVYNITREALINAFRHSGATLIRVYLSFTPYSIEVKVEDNGSGFSQSVADSARQGHFGLQTMSERAEKIGGTLTITPADGGGTRVRLQVVRRRRTLVARRAWRLICRRVTR